MPVPSSVWCMLDSLRGLDMPVGRAFGWGSDPEQWLVLSPALESSNGRLGGSRLGLKGLGGLGLGGCVSELG